MGKYYTLKQVAAQLNISVDTVRRRISRGKITAEKVTGVYGEQWVIKDSELQRLKKHTSEIVKVDNTVKTSQAEVKNIIREVVRAELEQAHAEQLQAIEQLLESRGIKERKGILAQITEIVRGKA